jgi:hypothetical protein
VDRAAALLTTHRRAAAFVALFGALLAYSFAADSIPNVSLWWDVALLAFVVFPATLLLVWLALPLQRARGLLPLALGFVVVAVLCEVGDVETIGNFAKLGAMTAFAFWFLDLFQDLAWVVIVACAIPWVDAYSVWRGPTGKLVEDHSEVFDVFSMSFPLPHEDSDPRLGIPDLLFFALFLATAARFRLRAGWTLVAMVAGLGATVAIAVWTDVSGLPALPALSLGFLLPNLDRAWAAVRHMDLRRTPPEQG